MHHSLQAHHEFIAWLSCENLKSFLTSMTMIFNPRGFSRVYSPEEHKGPVHPSVPHQHSTVALNGKTKFILFTN